MDIKDVEDLAGLARIDLDEEEKKELLSDMKGILDYVKIIEKVETNNAMPMDSLENVWREDLPTGEGEIALREFSHELIVEQFPDAQGRIFKG